MKHVFVVYVGPRLYATRTVAEATWIVAFHRLSGERITMKRLTL